MFTRLIFKCVLILKPLPLSGEVYSELVDDADGTFTVKACEKSGCDCTSLRGWLTQPCAITNRVEWNALTDRQILE